MTEWVYLSADPERSQSDMYYHTTKECPHYKQIEVTKRKPKAELNGKTTYCRTCRAIANGEGTGATRNKYTAALMDSDPEDIDGL